MDSLYFSLSSYLLLYVSKGYRISGHPSPLLRDHSVRILSSSPAIPCPLCGHTSMYFMDCSSVPHAELSLCTVRVGNAFTIHSLQLKKSKLKEVSGCLQDHTGIKRRRQNSVPGFSRSQAWLAQLPPTGPSNTFLGFGVGLHKLHLADSSCLQSWK